MQSKQEIPPPLFFCLSPWPETRWAARCVLNAWGDAMSIRIAVRTSLGGVTLLSISKCRTRSRIHLRRRRVEHTSFLPWSWSYPSAPKLSENKTVLWKRRLQRGRRNKKQVCCLNEFMWGGRSECTSSFSAFKQHLNSLRDARYLRLSARILHIWKILKWNNN